MSVKVTVKSPNRLSRARFDMRPLIPEQDVHRPRTPVRGRRVRVRQHGRFRSQEFANTGFQNWLVSGRVQSAAVDDADASVMFAATAREELLDRGGRFGGRQAVQIASCGGRKIAALQFPE